MPTEEVAPNSVAASQYLDAAQERWEDAVCLFDADRFDGAVYLCGYVLECLLKYVLCGRRGQARLDLREARKLGHDLTEILDAAELSGELAANQDLWIALQTISNRWSVDLRYVGRSRSKEECERFLKDTQDLRNWLGTRKKR